MGTERILGIDLGTTNSAAAVLEGGDPEILPNEHGDRTTPSVVSYDREQGAFRVGRAAKNRTITHPERTVESIKRHMGDREYGVGLGGSTRSPEELSAMILQRLKHDAEAADGTEFDRAVITVPAYFDDTQRQATKDAGEIAGFEVERIVNEPTAAAMAYGLDEDPDAEHVLVYDLGGGTFDVSMLELGDGVFEVLATDGHDDLGGDDFDRAIIDHVADDFVAEHGIDLRENREAHQRLKEAAEAAKIDLSTSREAEITLPFVATPETGPIHLETTLDRATFESLTEHLLDRTVDPTRRVIEDAPVPLGAIDEVLLVGGATRMPMIRERVADLTAMEPADSINPEEVVALGAAIQAGVISGAVDDLVLLDVTPLSLGVEVQGGLFEPIIPRNTTVPTVESKPFTTAVDDQHRVSIRVFQGERAVAEDNAFLGEFTLRDIPPAPAGAPNIDVQFRIDENGILDVAAEDAGSGASGSVTLEGNIGLSEAEIERLTAEARAHAEADRRRRARVEAKHAARDALARAEQLLEAHPDAPADLRARIAEAIAAVEDALETEGATADDYEERTEDLTALLRDLGTETADGDGRPPASTGTDADRPPASGLHDHDSPGDGATGGGSTNS